MFPMHLQVMIEFILVGGLVQQVLWGSNKKILLDLPLLIDASFAAGPHLRTCTDGHRSHSGRLVHHHLLMIVQPMANSSTRT